VLIATVHLRRKSFIVYVHPRQILFSLISIKIYIWLKILQNKNSVDIHWKEQNFTRYSQRETNYLKKGRLR
jgi:hypothetical protein